MQGPIRYLLVGPSTLQNLPEVNGFELSFSIE